MAQMPDINELLKRWPSLPDEAVAQIKLVSAVTGLAERTVRHDPRFERVYVTQTRYGIRVGNVRKVLAGGNSHKLGDVAQRVVESCRADIPDHNIKMQRELNQRRENGGSIMMADARTDRIDDAVVSAGEARSPTEVSPTALQSNSLGTKRNDVR
jgi:hypothetical protein